MKCGNCAGDHHEVATVRACYAGNVSPCTWLVERHGFDDDNGGERWDIIEECGASSVVDERGSRCEAGHEHVEAEVREAEGWDYASDEEEADQRARYGYESRLSDGHVHIPR